MGDITRSTRKVMMDYDTRRQVEVFAEEAVHDFKNETPIFQKKIEDCLFLKISSTSMIRPSERYYVIPTCRNSQKP